MTLSRFALATLTALPLLAACATTASDAVPLDDPRLGKQVDRVCFTRGITGFSEAERRTVVVTRGVDEQYLLVMRTCPSLRRAESLGLGGGLTNGSGCLRENDRIIVSESVFDLRGPGQIGPLSCAVDEIYRWDAEVGEVDDVSDGESALMDGG